MRYPIQIDLDENELYPGDKYADMSQLESEQKPITEVKDESTGEQEGQTKQVTVKTEPGTATSKDRSVPGLDVIIKCLKKKYGLNEEEKVFKHYEDFENIKRDKTILSYRLLKGASLGDDEKIVRTSVIAMTLEEMKKTLLKATS